MWPEGRREKAPERLYLEAWQLKSPSGLSLKLPNPDSSRDAVTGTWGCHHHTSFGKEGNQPSFLHSTPSSSIFLLDAFFHACVQLLIHVLILLLVSHWQNN